MAVAVVEVEVKEPGVERSRQHRFKRGARMQKPRWRDRQQQRANPPEPGAKWTLEDQADGDQAGEGDERRGGARDENRLAEQQVGNHLCVNADAQVVGLVVEKIGREQVAGVVTEAVAHEVRSQHRLHGFVGEEIDRETIGSDQPGHEKDGQRPGKQRGIEPLKT